jgi:hypothetical protein
VPLPNHVARKLATFSFAGPSTAWNSPSGRGSTSGRIFGYIQHLAQYGRLPSRSDPASDQLCRSVELAPVSAAAAEFLTESLTHDSFWRLPPGERLSRERELRELRSSGAGKGALMQYEAQQPPLYYLLLAIPYLAVKDFSLPALTLRFASLLISAAGILLCCPLASQVPACVPARGDSDHAPAGFAAWTCRRHAAHSTCCPIAPRVS